MANKIKYGIRKAYYAVISIGTGGTVSYGTPVALPGAVSISMDPQGDINKFYADDVVYYQSSANNGYEGDLELAKIPDSFLKDVLGELEDDNDLLVEVSDPTQKSFALMFEFQGDDKATRHVFYNCTASRPAVAGQTKEESIEPQTETITISAIPNEDGYVKAKALEGSTKYSSWYTSVQLPTFTPPVPDPGDGEGGDGEGGGAVG